MSVPQEPITKPYLDQLSFSANHKNVHCAPNANALHCAAENGGRWLAWLQKERRAFHADYEAAVLVLLA